MMLLHHILVLLDKNLISPFSLIILAEADADHSLKQGLETCETKALKLNAPNFHPLEGVVAPMMLF